MTQLDTNYVRKQFTQIHDNPNLVFASNAGGSYVCNQVNRLLTGYNEHMRVQPYNAFAPSADAGVAMDRAKTGWAKALGIDLSELTIGPSTSMNTYVMAQALGANWGSSDEIIVTNQDHEANNGVWRRKAAERGAIIKEWKASSETGLLNTEDLESLLTMNTKWVFFTHCSNIAGTINPVAEICKLVKSTSQAKVFVDAVAYAPHGISNIKDLGVDAYVFSLYKVFGPHQSIMYFNRGARGSVQSQAHYFLNGDYGKAFNPAGPQHAQVAACAGVLDYFDDLYSHHFNADETNMRVKLDALHQLISGYETEITAPILEQLQSNSNIKVIGKSTVEDGDRAPTIAFHSHKQSSAEITAKLQAKGIGTEHGDFYAHRLITDLGINPEDGVVRISLLHYNSVDDVEIVINALDESLE